MTGLAAGRYAVCRRVAERYGAVTQRITDIQKMTVVFRDGVGYDTQKLIQSVDHAVGLH